MASSNFWWSNAIFFVVVHLAALTGAFFCPPHRVPGATLVLWFVFWQLGCFGITVGYHRLYSHRAFKASLGVRIILAAMGSSAFQGSIKWWCLRHRLHHRFTDHPVHDPYAATKGLLYSHMGWIFFKPRYERMALVDHTDLSRDPVIRFQHRFYIPFAILFGFLVPTAIGSLWCDSTGGFVWGGLVSKVAIWHCTFLVNSLAHWHGVQPYSDDDTSRGSLILALLTAGEGNHNFHHAFPHDFRSGPSLTAWDPSKWIILILQYCGFASHLRRARDHDINEAKSYMKRKLKHGIFSPSSYERKWDGPVWKIKNLEACLHANAGRCFILINGFVLDVTDFLQEHPGGAGSLKRYSLKPGNANVVTNPEYLDASWAFCGGLNNHSRAAKSQMRSFRVAKFSD